MTRRWFGLRTIVAALALSLASGCRGRGAPSGDPRGVMPEATDATVPAVPFEVRNGATDLVLIWFDAQGLAHAASRVDDVPAERRSLVRVDPSRPELRSPGWVYVADLTAPDAQGKYPARSMRAAELSTQVLALGGQSGPLGTPTPAGGNGPTVAAAAAARPTVIIYGASWCHACHQAATWLQQHHIPFVEKDIEQDQAAAQELQEKARRARIPTGSIPILDVRGHMLVGFSPPAMEEALRGG